MACKNLKIFVEGNIGAGKSKFCEYFGSMSSDVETFLEPISLWRDCKGFDLYNLMHKNVATYAGPFQANVVATYLHLLMREQRKPVRLVERSILTSQRCFTRIAFDSGIMEPNDYNSLHEYFEWALNFECTQPDLIVYLRASPEECLKRIQARNRKSEEGLDLSFLTKLHQFHEQWLNPINKPEIGEAPVFIFDASQPWDELKDTYDQKKEDLLLFGTKNDFIE
ncbi:thymidine kinase 2, mitochondrial [Cichlidogyrus casuarinus]|uniref:Thymidine kinase 2, mitochondrial n=1 Tax=Cichlidogyrus casuarinus TaxID=1844966 RepID=A0ABD2QGH0_9PLAT